MAQMRKNLLAMQTWVQFLAWEDLLEKRMNTHSSILAWKIPWREEHGLLQPGLVVDWATSTSTSTSIVFIIPIDVKNFPCLVILHLNGKQAFHWKWVCHSIISFSGNLYSKTLIWLLGVVIIFKKYEYKSPWILTDRSFPTLITV